MMNFISYLLLSLSFQSLIHLSNGHSWISCTDYTGGKTTYDASACKGQPRYGQNLGTFGSDIGFDFRPKTAAANGPCQTNKWAYINQGNQYGAESKMAEYAPGQKVTLAFPGKNHGKVPDQGIHVYRSATQQKGDDFISSKDYGLVKFDDSCSGSGDKDLCTMDVQLEADLQPGIYSFRWVWEFNKGEFYATCWEARVGDYAVPATTMAPATPVAATPASPSYAPSLTPTVVPYNPTVTPAPPATPASTEAPATPVYASPSTPAATPVYVSPSTPAGTPAMSPSSC